MPCRGGKDGKGAGPNNGKSVSMRNPEAESEGIMLLRQHGAGMDTENRSQHRKLTLENKILRPLLPGLEPLTFPS